MNTTLTVKRTYDICFFPTGIFDTFGHFEATRERYGLPIDEFKLCFICGCSFKETDSLFLISVEKVGNRLICKKCHKRYNKEAAHDNP